MYRVSFPLSHWRLLSVLFIAFFLPKLIENNPWYAILSSLFFECILTHPTPDLLARHHVVLIVVRICHAWDLRVGCRMRVDVIRLTFVNLVGRRSFQNSGTKAWQGGRTLQGMDRNYGQIWLSWFRRWWWRRRKRGTRFLLQPVSMGELDGRKRQMRFRTVVPLESAPEVLYHRKETNDI